MNYNFLYSVDITDIIVICSCMTRPPPHGNLEAIIMDGLILMSRPCHLPIVLEDHLCG